MADKLIYVMAGEKAGTRVALSEQNDAHPDGQAFVHAGNGTQRVAETPAVLQALSHGFLEKTEAPAKNAKGAAPKGNEPDNKPNDGKPADNQPPTPPTT